MLLSSKRWILAEVVGNAFVKCLLAITAAVAAMTVISRRQLVAASAESGLSSSHTTSALATAAVVKLLGVVWLAAEDVASRTSTHTVLAHLAIVFAIASGILSGTKNVESTSNARLSHVLPTENENLMG